MSTPIPITVIVTTLSITPVLNTPTGGVIGINFIPVTDGIFMVTVATTISTRGFGPAIFLSQGVA